MPSRAVAFELPAWARIAGHEHVGEQTSRTGTGAAILVRFGAARVQRVLAADAPAARRAASG